MRHHCANTTLEDVFLEHIGKEMERQMTMGILTVLWEKWVEFRHNFFKITSAAMIAPLLYILVFRFGVQTVSHGQPLSELSDPRCSGSYYHERKLQCHCPTLNVAAPV